MPTESEIKFLWDAGYSRNRISSILHLGHAQVQKIVENLPIDKHKLAIERRREHTKELIQRKLDEHQNINRTTASEIVKRNQDIGIKARYNPEYEDAMIRIKREEGSP